MSHIQPKLSAPARAKAGPDRRRSDRKADGTAAFIHSPTSAAESSRMPVAGLNVSRHGLAFSIDKNVAVGSYFMLGVPDTREREILILHCKPLGDGRFGVGAEFA